jgi:hypothetical protein
MTLRQLRGWRQLESKVAIASNFIAVPLPQLLPSVRTWGWSIGSANISYASINGDISYLTVGLNFGVGDNPTILSLAEVIFPWLKARLFQQDIPQLGDWQPLKVPTNKTVGSWGGDLVRAYGKIQINSVATTSICLISGLSSLMKALSLSLWWLID